MIKFVLHADLQLIVKDRTATKPNLESKLIDASKAGYIAALERNVLYAIPFNGEELPRVELPDDVYVALAASQSSREDVVAITHDLKLHARPHVLIESGLGK